MDKNPLTLSAWAKALGLPRPFPVGTALAYAAYKNLFKKGY